MIVGQEIESGEQAASPEVQEDEHCVVISERRKFNKDFEEVATPAP